MTKLKSAVLYEYLTKVRAIGIFYLIQYLIVALIFAIVAICTEGKETGSNTLEFSSVVFVSVIGVLGYKEDFKALLQNGYTRKYIFGATICMFTLLAGTMALVDTIIGNAIKGGVLFATLNLSDVGRVAAGQLSKLFLTQSFFCSIISNTLSDYFCKFTHNLNS